MKRLDSTPAVAPAPVRIPTMRMHCKTPAELAAYEARERRAARAAMDRLMPPVPTWLKQRYAELDAMEADAKACQLPRVEPFTVGPLDNRPDPLAYYSTGADQ